MELDQHQLELLDGACAAQAAAGQTDCLGAEVEGYAMNAAVWNAFWNGYGPNRTELEQHLNELVFIAGTYGRDGMYRYVLSIPGFERLCQVWAS